MFYVESAGFLRHGVELRLSELPTHAYVVDAKLCSFAGEYVTHA